MISAKHIVWIFLLIGLYSFGQDSLDYRRNHVYLEVLGPGGMGSVNYERSLILQPNYRFGLAVGIAPLRFKDFRRKFNPNLVFSSLVKFEVSLQKLIPDSNIGIELFAGNTMNSVVTATTIDQFERVNQQNGTFGVLYRFTFPAAPLKLRIGYTPIIEEYERYRHWFAGSIGFMF